MNEAKNERIAKRLARAGLCSRREAERWIAAGRVAVNGEVLESPAVVVGHKDRIYVDGKLLAAPAATQLWRYHKPRGLVTSHRDEKGRPTVFDALPRDLPRLVSVGRLDITSEGLLLLTNDGALARYLEHPSTALTRRYRARVHGNVDDAALRSLAKGVTVNGVRYASTEISIDRRGDGKNSWLNVSLREGKNREVRKLLIHAGLVVNRLIRISYGPYQLGNLKAGKVADVSRKVLHEQLGRDWTEKLR